MPKQTYVPTPADRATGRKLRALRRRAGETLDQTIERSGVGFGNSTLSKVELGQRPLTLPEATKLAAHFNTTPDRVKVETWPGGPQQTTVATEQEWLGNPDPDKPALFAVPDRPAGSASGDVVGPDPRTMLIDLDAPLSPTQYREQVWIPYLENRYAADLRQTG